MQKDYKHQINYRQLLQDYQKYYTKQLISMNRMVTSNKPLNGIKYYLPKYPRNLIYQLDQVPFMLEREMRIMPFSTSRKVIDTYQVIWILCLGQVSIILNKTYMKEPVTFSRELSRSSRKTLNGNYQQLDVIVGQVIMKRV